MLARFRHIQRQGLSFYSTKSHVDICVVGAGIIGTAAVAAIAQSPYAEHIKIALIEGNQLSQDASINEGVYSNRVSSITPKSSKFLEDIRVWNQIRNERKTPYYNMNVWDAASDGRISFSGDNSDPIGHIVENRLIQSSLVEQILQLKGVEVYERQNVQKISIVDERPVLLLNSNAEISCDLLIGADGPMSKVREFAGIPSTGRNYTQTGLVATVSLNSTQNATAWQRFLPSGPIALLPLSEANSSIVWSLSGDLASRVQKTSPEVFVELVNAAFHNPLLDVQYLLSHLEADGSINVDVKDEAEWGRESTDGQSMQPPFVVGVTDKSRATFPLRLRHAESYISERVVLIGDAAHTVHPLAGQGLNLGLADAKSLSDCLNNGFRDGQDVGNPHLLEKYASERYMENAGVLFACDSLSRLFSNETEVLSLIRGFGFNILDQSQLVKSMIMKVTT
ncbi:hypothetical protein BC833DRAFT_521511 [Globomyces pollinis-pini]|nr:hypothetical protein BC833DRAFT_521511 [Globomyces pollinis-pini]